jgi:hypothetical protein
MHTIKCTGSKFETAELADLIVNYFSKNILREMVGQYDNQKEQDPKNWIPYEEEKKFVIEDFDSAYNGYWPSGQFEFVYIQNQPSNKVDFYMLDKAYMANTKNVVVSRQFDLKDEDSCCVAILTDATDQEIVAVIYSAD